MDAFTDRVHVLQAESERIKQYLHALPPEAMHQPSACTHMSLRSPMRWYSCTSCDRFVADLWSPGAAPLPDKITPALAEKIFIEFPDSL